MTFNVCTYGATGDGKTLDTAAVQSAIDECRLAGGGTVEFPSGRTFLIGTIYLCSNITVLVSENATILGSSNIADYGTDTGRCPYYPEPLDRCLIYAADAKNITLTGPGTIDGGWHGEHLPRQIPGSVGRESMQRPMLLRIAGCINVAIRDLNLANAYSWCTHLKYCDGVRLTGVNINNEVQDGFNLESCQNITISDCRLRCGDDGIALTTSGRDKPLKNLTVSNCVITSRWAGIRFGPLSKGNFENVVITGCVLHNCSGGGIKLGMFEGAAIRNCLFTGLIMDGVSAPIFILIARWTDIGSTHPDPPMMPVGTIENVTFHNIRVTAVSGMQTGWAESGTVDQRNAEHRPDRNASIFIHGHPKSPVRDISLSRVSASFPGGGKTSKPITMPDVTDLDIHEGGYWTDNKDTWGPVPAYGLYARHVEGLAVDGCVFKARHPDERPAIHTVDTEKPRR